MKRLLRTAMAVSVMGMGFVFSTGTVAADPVTTVQIANQAQLELFVPGTNGIGVQVHYVCSGGAGQLTVSATQTPEQSGTGVGAHGSLSVHVLCDGQPHDVSATILGTGTWNLGDGSASAALTAPSGNKTDVRKIDIVQ